MLGAAAVLVGVTKKPADVTNETRDGFGHLKAVLLAVSTAYVKHKVCLQPQPKVCL